MKRRTYTQLTAGVLLGALTLLSACSSGDPLSRLRKELETYPEFSVTLQDMDVRGNFTRSYYHQYKVMTGEKQEGSEDLVYRDEVRDFEEVKRKTYEKYTDFLGMVILSKGPDGKVDENQHPPGYQYVGNPRYGTWRSDNRGGSFWEFYGKYALLSHVIGSFGRPVYRSDWNSYRDYRGRGAPYFGPNREFGTNGTYTTRTNPTFYQRQQTRQQASNRRFSDKVRNRVNRSSSSSRGRSSGFGK